jgi:hypothetical protein
MMRPTPAIVALAFGTALAVGPLAPAGAQTFAQPTWAAKALGAPAELKVAASSRLRYEAIAGQPRVGFNDHDDLVNLRTTVFAEYDFGAVRLGGELFDSRVWSARPGTPVTTNEVNALEPVQAYVAIDVSDPLGEKGKASLQLGRFTLNLGSRRLVAADEYRNTTNGYTGARADLDVRGVRATFIYTLPQQRLPDAFDDLVANRVRFDREDFTLVLWGGQLSARPFGPTTIETSLYHLGERDAPGRPTTDRSLDTLSLRLYRDPARGKFDHELEVIGQWGESSASRAASAARTPVAASFVHAELGYTLTDSWRTRISLEYDRASGDKPGGRNTRFDTLFGMRRAEIAPAGIFNAIGRANLSAPALRVEAQPSKRLDAFALWRPLWLASRFDAFSTTGVRDPTGRSGSFAGHQLETRARYWLLPDRLRAEATLLWLAKGRFLRDAPNAPDNGDTRYASLNLTAYF